MIDDHDEKDVEQGLADVILPVGQDLPPWLRNRGRSMPSTTLAPGQEYHLSTPEYHQKQAGLEHPSLVPPGRALAAMPEVQNIVCC